MNNRAAQISFLVLLLLLMVAFAAIIRPFLLPALVAFLIAIICYPIHNLFLRWCRGRKYAASLLSTIAVFLCILIPLGTIVTIAAVNSVDAVSAITAKLEVGKIAQTFDVATVWIQTKLSTLTGAPQINFDLRARLVDFLTSLGKFASQYFLMVFTATANIVIGLVLIVVFIFVFFAEGKNLIDSILGLLPLADTHKQILAREIGSVITATFLAMIVTSVVQGILIGVGYWIVGIAKPFVWGVLAVGVTLIPMIGGPVMYVPAAIALIIGGHLLSGVFLLAYGIGIVSMVDNIIKPLVLRGKVDVHPVLLALSIIGGGMWAGVAGIIIGPVVVVLMLSMLRIYRQEFM